MPDRLDQEQISRLQRALTASSEELFQLVLDPSDDVLLALLKNPHLHDDHLLALLKRRDLSEELLKRIFQRQRDSGSHRLLLALVKNPGTPGTIVRTLLPRLRLFELVDLCQLPGVTPDQRLVAERAILVRLPTTPLGSKLTLARRATACVVGELLQEGHPALMEACLNNPRLKEADLYRFLNGPRATAETISLVARHSRWHQRPNLRLAILKNRNTPGIWFTLWLPRLPQPQLQQLLASRRLAPRQVTLLQEELQRRHQG